MATLGNSTTPGGGTWFDNKTNCEFWTARQFTMPAGGGIVNEFHLFAGGNSGSTSADPVIWDSSSNIKWHAPGAQNINNQQWYGWLISSGTPSSLYLPAGNYEFGFWASGTVKWIAEGSGGVHFRQFIGSAQPNTGSADEYNGAGLGELGCYIIYTPVTSPVVTSATPNVGTSGTSVAVAGSGFTTVTDVNINGATASFTINSDTSITATVPSGATPGSGNLVVTNPAGTGSVGFTVGQVYFGTGSGVGTIAAVKYGTGSGVGTAAGIWVPTGGPPPTGVKRVW